MISIGIPRALLYYQYYPAWKTFFEELGTEVVVSSPTTQVMVSEGMLTRLEAFVDLLERRRRSGNSNRQGH